MYLICMQCDCDYIYVRTIDTLMTANFGMAVAEVLFRTSEGQPEGIE